jgi:hypothetical protein
MYRTYFTFNDEVSDIGHRIDWFVSYFKYASLYNRLLNETYHSPKPDLLNFDFCNVDYFEKRGIAPIKFYNRGNSWKVFIIYNRDTFENFPEHERVPFIWKIVHENMKLACVDANNIELLNAAEHAYSKGIELNFRTDYIYLTQEVVLFGENVEILVHMKFEGSDLVAMLEIYKKKQLIYETEIERAYVGLDIFRDMIQTITVDSKQRIIVKMRGSKPRKIEIEDTIVLK